MTLEEAAAATEGSHYALSFIRKAKIIGGQEVLVYGATGAIGSAAVQLLKSLGANVTAVCATENVALVKGLGADRVIDDTVQDFTSDGQTYDVVLDAVGKSSFGRCRRLLRPRGIYLSSDLGPLAQNPVLALVTPLLRGRRVMFPIPTDNQEMVRYFKGLMESGDFKPVIDRRYPSGEIVEAYRYVETGQKVGSVVIALEPEAGSSGFHRAQTGLAMVHSSATPVFGEGLRAVQDVDTPSLPGAQFHLQCDAVPVDRRRLHR
jgi:NADPH:quinone reductase-like Zn-dependent oxidoreductase